MVDFGHQESGLSSPGFGVLALAQEIDNVRLACTRAGISDSQFYEIKAAVDRYSGWVPGGWLARARTL